MIYIVTKDSKAYEDRSQDIIFATYSKEKAQAYVLEKNTIIESCHQKKELQASYQKEWEEIHSQPPVDVSVDTHNIINKNSRRNIMLRDCSSRLQQNIKSPYELWHQERLDALSQWLKDNLSEEEILINNCPHEFYAYYDWQTVEVMD